MQVFPCFEGRLVALGPNVTVHWFHYNSGCLMTILNMRYDVLTVWYFWYIACAPVYMYAHRRFGESLDLHLQFVQNSGLPWARYIPPTIQISRFSETSVIIYKSALLPLAGFSLYTGFSWYISFSCFPCVYKRMLRWFPRFQVATTCFSCSPPDLNLLINNFIFRIHVK